MALADRIDCPPRALHGADCSVGILLRSLPTSEAAALQAMLDRYGEWTARAIYEQVKEEGHFIGHSSIGKHRRRTCRCFNAA